MAFNNENNDSQHDEEPDEDYEDLPLEMREEYRFKNGAIYKGQWKGTMRHGYGV